MKRFVPTAAGRSRAMMVAVVLGTALAAGEAQAGPDPKAVQDISRYCQACWRNARLPTDRWGDCTQEVFTRLLERVESDKWLAVLKDDETAERREFLRAIDAVKKRVQRARKLAGLTPDLADARGRGENTVRDDREAVAHAAREVLGPRQRRILELTSAGWAVPEIATELATTPERVSDEKYKAVRKLQHYFGTA
ncbi:MAG TPA: sigma-70 family RNA polymerase sigma factor [Urbifossiella sp.]|jgi:RNA polymerase sigma factor (sigma-70 family)|nr:sigma-70 family RNA polymerase sigma factor [Urbifossiella sp.]